MNYRSVWRHRLACLFLAASALVPFSTPTNPSRSFSVKEPDIQVPDGHYAVDLPISQSGLLAKVPTPGARVDIILEYKANDGKSVTRTILKDVLVLGVGGHGNDPGTVVVHFALKKAMDALTVTLAKEMGTLHLSSSSWERLWERISNPSSWLKR